MSRRRNSTIIDDFIPGINLNRAEQFELQTHFKKIPITTGGISFYDFVKTLKSKSHSTKITTKSTKTSETFF